MCTLMFLLCLCVWCPGSIDYLTAESLSSLIIVRVTLKCDVLYFIVLCVEVLTCASFL